MIHMHHGRMSSLDMTEGTIWPILLQFTIPLLLGNLFQLLYNTVDSIVVGNFVGRPALVAVAVVLWSFASPLTAMFIREDETIRFGTLFIRLCVPFATLCCFNQNLSGTLRGAGKSQVPMIITLCTHVLSRRLYLAVITRLLPGNVYAVGLSYPVGWILCAAVIIIYYRFSHWEDKYQLT